MPAITDFGAFFREVHGVDPFPWQQRLMQHVAGGAGEVRWPAMLDLPTGVGKTAAIDIAVFHVAMEAGHGPKRRAPLRVAFVVDRRLVVDDAYARARKLEAALRSALADPRDRPVTAEVARALMQRSGSGVPLVVRRLRGGIPREDDWARTPSQPTVLCSTVDQIGSRLLFRGYGVSDSMKPVHAGLIGSDCLILLDEAHLAEPFRQTLGWVGRYRSERWREQTHAGPWGVALLTATPAQADGGAFGLEQDDHDNLVLKRRLQARKPARLEVADDDAKRTELFAGQVQRALDGGARAVGVVLNRVARARAVFDRLESLFDPEGAEPILLIGPARPVQRDRIAERLARIRTGAPRDFPTPLVVVATQTIEAGVDIDLDALFTEAAPLDALRQRFGRLNRDGRPIEIQAAIVATKGELAARADDPVYGGATRAAWEAMKAAAAVPSAKRPGKTKGRGQSDVPVVVDFGIAHFAVPSSAEAVTTRVDAPILMPAHLDLLSQTAPIPGADPEVSLYLRGASRQHDAVTVIWRADLDHAAEADDASRSLALMPPRAAEAIALPVWVVRRWLTAPSTPIDALADLPTRAADESERDGRVREGRFLRRRKALRWRGLGDDTRWIDGDAVEPGDTIVVPAQYGGIDEHGWDPTCVAFADDVADAAAHPYRGRRYAVRVASGLAGDGVDPDRLARTLAGLQAENWRTVRDGLLRLGLPADLDDRLRRLDGARGRRGRPAVEVHFDAYGVNEDDAPRGVVFVAPRGVIRDAHEGGDDDGAADLAAAATEDDASGSTAGFAQSLRQHSAEVEACVAAFAAAAGLPTERIADLRLAGWLHDQGKRDRRFQRWMHDGAPLGADPDDEETVLAKSGRTLPRHAHAKAGLPPSWRHEALSVRLARADDRLRKADDAQLVLWLIGTHHGHGRPLFPHADPTEIAPDVGPQSLAFDLDGLDWPSLFDLLKRRYGVWELARMEAILRLADHRASEAAAQRQEGEA